MQILVALLLGIILCSASPPVISHSTVDEICRNIDERLPCLTRELRTEFSAGKTLGNFIGTATGADIKAFYESSDSCPVYSQLFEVNGDFRRFITEYMSLHEVSFPVEHEELVSMAVSAGIAPEIAFIQNACAELSLLLGDDIAVSSAPIKVLNEPPIFAPYFSSTGEHKVATRAEHCSDVGLLRSFKSKISAVQGHNEDWWSTVADKMSVLTTSDWMGYLYPGQLAGTSVVVNKHGLSLTMNSLYPGVPGYTSKSIPSGHGVAYVFAYVLRAVVNATTTDEVIRMLSRFPIYSGYSLNVMSGCEDSITNIEGYGSVLGILRHSASTQVGFVQGHFNSYTTLSVQQNPISTSSERAKCLANSNIASPSDIRNYLGNLSCPMFFTDINGLHSSETLSSWIIDPDAQTCFRYRLPVDCKVSLSRCLTFPGFQEPKVYPWEFACPTSQHR